MTPAQARTGALVALVLGVLGVYLSKRASTDIAVAVLATCAFIYFCVSSLAAVRRQRARERAQRERRDVPWTYYSRPCGVGRWEVGIERKDKEGVVLRREPADKVLDANDSFEISIAESDAMMKASRWTENKVDM